jgi:hypothetical protein
MALVKMAENPARSTIEPLKSKSLKSTIGMEVSGELSKAP